MTFHQAISRYMIRASLDDQPNDNMQVPEHVTKAKAHLEAIKKIDPQLHRQTMRFFRFRRKHSLEQ